VISVQAPVATTPVATPLNVSSTSVAPSTSVARATGAAATTTVPPTTTSSSSTVPTAPALPSLQPGEASLSVGDEGQSASTTRQNNAISVSSGSLNATFAPADASGNASSLDSDGNIRLKVGDKIKIRMAGFLAGSEVETWLFSTPTLLGRTKVDAKGTIDTDFVIPKSVPNGMHRIALKATTADKRAATIGLGVMVGEWKKGRSTTVLVIVVALAIAIMGGLMLPAVSRRRRRS
jgi:hypothetical protein